MRVLVWLAFLLLAPVARPAAALVFVQDISVRETSGDFVPFDVRGLPHDPGAGSLTAVTAELFGTVRGRVQIDTTAKFPDPATLRTHWVLTTQNGPDPYDRFSDVLGDETIRARVTGTDPVTGSSTILYVGSARSFDKTFHMTAFTPFLGPTIPGTYLFAYGFTTDVIGLLSPFSGQDDTTFDGTVRLTYEFTSPNDTSGPPGLVPEPASIVLLGSLGVFALGWRRGTVLNSR